MSIKIIAEIGNTHEGSQGLAKRFIDAVKKAGADVVKFQTHIFEAESLLSAPNPPYFQDETRKEYFERTAFNLEQYKELKKYAESLGLEFMSSPFSLEAVDLLEDLQVNSYKVPSGEVSNLPLLEKIACTGKKVYLSSGMSSNAELDEAIQVLQGNGANNIVLFQCTSKYPCPPSDSGINILKQWKKKYKFPVGFSDHTVGYGAAAAAVSAGAFYIEKHFTLSKLMYGSDAKHSMEPDEFSLFIKILREVDTVNSCEVDKDALAIDLKEMKKIFEKSIVANQNLLTGTVIEKKHLAFKKPGNGINASKYKDVLGKTLNQDLKKDDFFSFDFIS